MTGKTIYELKLNSKDSIFAYEKENYDTCYEDSLLYLRIDGKKTKIAESSFGYGFGAEMYYRMYNIKEFTDKLSCFPILLAESFNNWSDDEEMHKIYNTYYFANGNSKNNLALYLLKSGRKYSVLNVKLWADKKTQKYNAKILNNFTLCEEVIEEWKAVISAEWEKRAVEEGEKISDKKPNKEDWQKYFIAMRTDNKK